MADEEEHKKSEEEHKGEGAKAGGIAGSFQKHKTLWIVGGVGAAGVLLLLFMNSGGGSSSSSTPSTDTSGINTQGAGGAVDTSSLVGSGGYPSWYNPGAAENLDYWPYVPVSHTGSDKSGSSGSKSGSSGSKSGSKSGSSSSKSGSKSGGSKSTSGGVTHGSGHHGVSKGTKTSTNKNKVSANPHAGGAHGYVYTTKGGETLQGLQNKAWPGSSASIVGHPRKATSNTNILTYANNKKILSKQLGTYSTSKPLPKGIKINL